MGDEQATIDMGKPKPIAHCIVPKLLDSMPPQITAVPYHWVPVADAEMDELKKPLADTLLRGTVFPYYMLYDKLKHPQYDQTDETWLCFSRSTIKIAAGTSEIIGLGFVIHCPRPQFVKVRLTKDLADLCKITRNGDTSLATNVLTVAREAAIMVDNKNLDNDILIFKGCPVCIMTLTPNSAMTAIKICPELEKRLFSIKKSLYENVDSKALDRYTRGIWAFYQ